MKNAQLLAILHGQPQTPKEQTPKDKAAGAAREALADLEAVRAKHTPDSPEAHGAQARLDRALELFRAAPREPDVSMDGGVRAVPPGPGPSHEATLLGILGADQERADELAEHFDRHQDE